MWFKVDTGINPNEYKCIFTDKLWDELQTGIMRSSWLVLYARLHGLQYADFLRYVRQEFNATLCGRNSTYIHFYFTNRADCEKFVEYSNRRFTQWKNSSM